MHRGGSLADGELVGDCVQCPLHGSRFRLEDGSVEQGPAAYPQPALEARVRDGSIEVRAPQRPVAPSEYPPAASPEPANGSDMAEIKTVGVLGAGLMGHGIAQVAAQAGYDVVLREVDDDRLAAGVGKIEKQLARAVEKGKLEQADADAARGRIATTTDYGELAGLRPRDRGDHRGPRPQARDVARARRDRQARGVARDEHLLARRRRPGRRHLAARSASSACTSSTRRR